MSRKLTDSVMGHLERLEVLEVQGHADALLELFSMVPLAPRKLTASLSEMLDQLEWLELQGHGNALLELSTIVSADGEDLLNSGFQFLQPSSLDQSSKPNYLNKFAKSKTVRKIKNFAKVTLLGSFFGKTLPKPVEAQLDAAQPHGQKQVSKDRTSTEKEKVSSSGY